MHLETSRCWDLRVINNMPTGSAGLSSSLLGFLLAEACNQEAAHEKRTKTLMCLVVT